MLQAIHRKEPHHAIHTGMTEAQASQQDTCIKVVGIGQSGGDAVEHMIECGVHGVEFLRVHTSTQAVPSSHAHHTIVLDRDACAATLGHIRALLAGTDLLFITVGMGGDADTAAALAIARAAGEMDILTVGLASAPCQGSDLAGWQTHVDSVLVARDSPLRDLSWSVVRDTAAILNDYGYVNVDFADVRTVMREAGGAVMGSAQACGPQRARTAAMQAVQGLRLSDAQAMLVLVTAAKGSLKLAESRQAMEVIQTCSSPHAHVIYGAAHDDSLDDRIRVTLVATGLAGEPL